MRFHRRAGDPKEEISGFEEETSGFEFEMRPYSTKAEWGVEGIAGRFGRVSTSRTKYSRRRKKVSPGSEVRLQGDHMPATVYRALVLNDDFRENTSLTVDGVPVEFDYNRRAIRSRSRALRITYLDRSYRYTVLHPLREFVLERSGVTVALEVVKDAGGRRGRPGRRVTVTGDADAIDIALAVVLPDADTIVLTSFGAVLACVGAVSDVLDSYPRRSMGSADYSDSSDSSD
ncbi:hypothetical protein [Streptomyces sp. NPDC007172]|uniref:hypothetical protein n=1 Tax=Streptomyces sp. NPDC007172 TaxID=3364776 RepID=UPI003696CF6B